jgi:tetratricopeptide (TPR) repeat protein
MHGAEKVFRAQEYEQAEEAYRAALQSAADAGSETGRVAALDGLAMIHAYTGRLQTADSLYTQVLAMQRQRFAADSLSGMYLVRTLGSLGEINLRHGQLDRADGFFSEILRLDASGDIDLRPEEGALAYALHGRSQVLRARGDTAGADSLAARAAGLQMYTRAFMQYVGDDIAEAEQTYLQALAKLEEAVGRTHADVGRAAHALGQLYEYQGRTADAVSQYQRAVASYEDAGGDPGEFAHALQDLAAAIAADRPDEAARLRQHAVRLLRAAR